MVAVVSPGALNSVNPTMSILPIDERTTRVITDGLPPPALVNPQKPVVPKDGHLGVDHWVKTDPTFRVTRNITELFIDGREIFPAMEGMLRSARQSIRLDFYIFSGHQASRIAEILAERQKAGVDVRIMLDPHKGEIPMFQISENQIIQYLEANGVEARFYPLQQIDPGKPDAGRIDHNKLVVVDGRQAMVGGMNIADEFINNHDVMVKVTGPAVTDLKRQFDQAWNLAGNKAAPPPEGPEPLEQGDSLVRVVGTGAGGRRTAEAVLLEQLRKARRHVYLEMFELTSPRLIEALIAAKERGVDVRVLSDPGEHGRFLGIPVPTGIPNLPTLYKLRGAGIQVRWYELQPGQVHDHLKLSIIDDAVVVGALNWTDSALQNNAETSLEISGGNTYRRILQMFADDWNNRSRPTPQPSFYRRGLQTLINWAN